MSDGGFRDDDLRESFLSAPPGAGSVEGCPPPERILKAVLGELSIRDNRSLADHGAVCPVCAVSWKLAREYAAESGLRERGAIRGLTRRWWEPLARRWVPAAAAVAAAALAVVVVLWQQRPTRPPVLRTLGQETIEARIPEGEVLSADHFTLRWSPGPEGVRYDVRVTDHRLTHLDGAASLGETEYTVPPAALAGLEPGAVVLWQVEMILPDGRRVVSRTFSVRLE